MKPISRRSWQWSPLKLLVPGINYNLLEKLLKQVVPVIALVPVVNHYPNMPPIASKTWVSHPRNIPFQKHQVYRAEREFTSAQLKGTFKSPSVVHW